MCPCGSPGRLASCCSSGSLKETQPTMAFANLHHIFILLHSRIGSPLNNQVKRGLIATTGGIEYATADGRGRHKPWLYRDTQDTHKLANIPWDIENPLQLIWFYLCTLHLAQHIFHLHQWAPRGLWQSNHPTSKVVSRWVWVVVTLLVKSPRALRLCRHPGTRACVALAHTNAAPTVHCLKRNDRTG